MHTLLKVTTLLLPGVFSMCGADLAAQTTWIVDAQNRPGAHFTDLPPAVDAATRGDILLVRHVDPLVASYTGARISKALTIVGVGGQPGITGRLEVMFLPVGDNVLLRDLRLAPFPSGTSQVGNCSLLIQMNQGGVHLQNVDRDLLFPLVPALNQNLLQGSKLITFTECSLTNLRIVECERVSMHRTHVFETAPFQTVGLEESRLILIDSSVSGTVAVRSCDADLHLAGTSRVAGSAWAVADGTSATCQGQSVITTGPSATLGSVSGNPLVRAAPVTALGAYLDANDTLEVVVTGAPAGIAILMAGVAAASPLSLWGEHFYLDPSAFIVVGNLPLDTVGRASLQVPIAPSIPVGSSILVQCIVLDVANNPTLTTAGVAIKA